MRRQKLVTVQNALRYAHIVNPAVEELPATILARPDEQRICLANRQIDACLRRNKFIVVVGANKVVGGIAYECNMMPVAIVTRPVCRCIWTVIGPGVAGTLVIAELKLV